jgi:hypothetical protein
MIVETKLGGAQSPYARRKFNSLVTESSAAGCAAASLAEAGFEHARQQVRFRRPHSEINSIQILTFLSHILTASHGKPR